MKKKIFFVTLLLFSFSVKAEIIYDAKNPKTICNEVIADNIKIKIKNFYDSEEHEVGKVANSCSNTTYYNNNLKTKVSGESYDSWVWHGRIDSTNIFYAEGEEKNKDDYQQFIISNRAQAYDDETGILNRLNTLKPGDKYSIVVNLNEDKFASNKYKDLRIILDYGLASGDINIISRNSIGYYIIGSDNNLYGPYRLNDFDVQEQIVALNTLGNKITSTKYRLVSENLLNNIPSNIEVVGFKLVPYDFYNTRTGYFRLYSLKFEGYQDAYKSDKKYITLNNAEDKIRHNITDNMLALATLKWGIADDNKTELHFYHHFTSKTPIIYKKGDSIRYGIPYVNTVKSTIDSFINNTTKSKDENNKIVYNYNFPTKYIKTVTSSKGNEIVEGTDIGDVLYVDEGTTMYADSEIRNQEVAANDYIKNNNYFFGLDCSSSTYLAEGLEIPVVSTMALSNRYSTSAEIELLGDVYLDNKSIEDYLRDQNILGRDEYLTDSTYDTYYSQYFKINNEEQKIYDSYALAVPGDIIAKRGHVRMASGYPYVECNDGTSIRKYTSDYCSNHGGINPGKSYVITTEIGGTYKPQAQRSYKFNGVSISGADNFVKETDTLWSFKLNPLYTDITKVDDYLNINGSYSVNNRYSFSDLYGTEVDEEADEIAPESGMYMAFRYKVMNNITNNKIEDPAIKVVNANTSEDIIKNKELKGTIISNYIIRAIKYEIGNETYYYYPNQLNVVSLYNNTPEDIKEKIKSLDSNNFKLKVSVLRSNSVGSGITENNLLIDVDSTEDEVSKELTIDIDEEKQVIKKIIDNDEAEVIDKKNKWVEQTVENPKTGAAIAFVVILLSLVLIIIKVYKKNYNKNNKMINRI